MESYPSWQRAGGEIPKVAEYYEKYICVVCRNGVQCVESRFTRGVVECMVNFLWQ